MLRASLNNQPKMSQPKLVDELEMQRKLKQLSTKILSAFFSFTFAMFRAWTTDDGMAGGEEDRRKAGPHTRSH
jgi:hypothetical protein